MDSSGLFSGRRVLISPISFGRADWSTRRFHMSLTMDKVKNSRTIDTNRPVSRQHERDYYGYFGYPYYWGAAGIWGWLPFLGCCHRNVGPTSSGARRRRRRPLCEVPTRSVAITFRAPTTRLATSKTWAVRYLVVDISNWWFGRKALIAPAWTRSVSWDKREVHVAMNRPAIKDSPEWNGTSEIERDFETRVYDYHGLPVYWKTTDQSGIVPPLHR